MKQGYIFRVLCPLVLMLALAACGESSSGVTSAPPGSVSVNVIETDFKISSSMTTFKPGQTYHFIVANNGEVAHEFMIMPKAEGGTGMNMSEMDKDALAMISNLNPGEIKTLDYTFPPTAANTHPQFACYINGHYEAGMKEDLTIAQ